jgi:hypothetical protein
VILQRTDGQPEDQTFTGVPAALHLVTIFNGDPGLKAIDLKINGNQKLKEKGLQPGERVTIDIASELSAGPNTVVVSGKGKKGSTAAILLHD